MKSVQPQVKLINYSPAAAQLLAAAARLCYAPSDAEPFNLDPASVSDFVKKLREMGHFLEERLCLRAQWEIRAVADRIPDLVRPVLASVFDGAGPKCIRLGGCP